MAGRNDSRHGGEKRKDSMQAMHTVKDSKQRGEESDRNEIVQLCSTILCSTIFCNWVVPRFVAA